MWYYARDDVSAVAPIDSEISIGREQDGIRQRLGHAHEAGVGEAHGHVCVLLHELQHGLQVIRQLEGNEQGTAAKERTQTRRAARPEQVESL
jgi:hypothetical protein